MNCISHTKAVFLLIFIAVIPAIAQLIFYGFTPPVTIPFGITAELALKQSDTILWVDARPENLFEIAHIPKALNLNRDNWNRDVPQLFETYEPKNTIVVYCSPDCFESEEIAKRIRALGFEHVLVLEGGFDAWKKANPGL